MYGGQLSCMKDVPLFVFVCQVEEAKLNMEQVVKEKQFQIKLMSEKVRWTP